MNEFFKELQEENGLIKRDGNGSTDIKRILGKIDYALSKNDYRTAERILEYSLEDAKAENRTAKKLIVLNEMTGLYRKTNQKEKAYQAVKKAFETVKEQALSGTVSDATVSLNAATVFNHFGENEKALELYNRAEVIYRKELSDDDDRLAGLFNNRALAFTALKRYTEAEQDCLNALRIMLQKENGAPEAAITCLNLADLIIFRDGYENGAVTADEYVQKAIGLLESKKDAIDGNYAFVCEKCAPVFEHYGYFEYAKQLSERSEKIYAGS